MRIHTVREGADPIWHLYPVRILEGRRREVFDKMRASGIGVQVNYIPVYWHPVFEDLGYRQLVGVSRKRFLGELLDGRATPGRDVATHTITAICAQQGIWAVRTHEVQGNVDAVRVVEALR